MAARSPWFKTAVVLGYLVGALLLGHTLYTFRYVVRELVLNHVAGVAVQEVSELEDAARAAAIDDTLALTAAAEAFRDARPDLIDSIRIIDQNGVEIAATSGVSDTPLSDVMRQTVLDSRSHHVVEVRPSPRGELLVVALPFRYQFPAERAGRVPGTEPTGQPRFKIAEIVLPVEAAAAEFWTLRRALAITLVAAVVLLVAMTVFTVQFRRYVNAKQLEQQLATARLVQQELVPRTCADCGDIDVAIEFQPAFDVGGDFCDTFRGPNGDIVLVLGDVAGKGLPAALLMGVVLGAVRAASSRWTGANQAELASQLNELLCERTPADRYATLFWGFLDAEGQVLHYVNAGHPPPLLMRARVDGADSEWLAEGGTVVGLLPGMPYAAGTARLAPGDRLVVFSDGLSEAADDEDREFGSEGILAAVRAGRGRSSAAAAEDVLQAVRTFAGGRPLADDLTLLVVTSGKP